jgi:hypothetical protein
LNFCKHRSITVIIHEVFMMFVYGSDQSCVEFCSWN